MKKLFFDLTSFVSKVIVDLVRDTYLESKTMMKTTVLTLHHLHAKIMSISKNFLGLGAAITELRGPWKPN